LKGSGKGTGKGFGIATPQRITQIIPEKFQGFARLFNHQYGAVGLFFIARFRR